MNKNTLYLWALLMAAFSFAPANAECEASCAKAASCDTGCAQSQNLWQPHAFSAYSSRDMMMKKSMYDTQSARDEWFGTFVLAPEYMSSFGQKCGSCKNLGALPFWSGTNSMTYGTNDGESNLDAYQLGMGNVVGQGTITISPKVMHVGTDMMLHFKHKKDERGLWFTLKAPIGAMSVNTKVTETIAPNNGGFKGTDLTATGDYMTGTTYQNTADGAVDTAFLSYPAVGNRYNSMTEAFAGGETNEGAVNSSLHKPIQLEFARIIGCCKNVAIRIGDASAALGYTCWANDKGFVDLGVKVSCPTGNVPTAKYALEPIFGRAGHWGLGAESTAHYKAWENEKGTTSVDLWLEGEVLHLFSGRKPSLRTFDLKQNGAGSKYMLLQHYATQDKAVASTTPTGGTDNVNLTGFTPSFITAAANVTTMPVISKFAVEGSVALMADLHHNDWNLSIGGEFWGRSRECLSIDACNAVRLNVPNLNDYAVLGRQISEDSRNFVATTAANRVRNLYLCEPLAKISKSQQTQLASSDVTGIVPGTSVFPLNSDLSAYPATPLPTGIVDARVATNRIPAALDEALDIAGAAARRAYTGKLFGQIGYTWNDNRYTPNVALTGSAEFAPANNNTAINLWSVGIIGALNF
ncbi:MAG: hypothetical protein NTU89_00845 [Candidatus Dependentiae bacterium]|nr:hypothetical protein [Candidatus Dependentiae bacterium]